MDVCAIYGSRRVQSTDLPVLYPDLTSISLLWINNARQVAVCDWWTILEVSAWYETHVSNNSNFKAAIRAKCRDAVFHTTPTPKVCYSVPSIVEVSGGCQSVNIICLRQRGITIVKWFASYAKSIDCANIHGFLRRLWIGSTDCAGRSMDIADPQIAPNMTLECIKNVQWFWTRTLCLPVYILKLKNLERAAGKTK